MTEQRYTLVDVCWTLFYSNTTFDFLDFAVKDKGYRCLRRIGRSWFGRKINVLLYKLFGYDWLRSRGLRYLKGKSRSELAAQAEQFYEEYLMPRRIEPVWEEVRSQKSDVGSQIVIVSGTLDIIAETVARHLGAEAYYATEMVYDANSFTGKFKDLLLTKASALPYYEHYDIITDNLTDIDLVRSAHKATIIVYNNKNRWAALLPPEQEVTYIDAREQRY
ncbi:MAG: haloacid dehalogenase-like hydrolase [Paludibacteraceae bacterium]|nr:haloacid dehalogenase-like hydrolase [Paludibacteraceae bacterium]